MHIRIKSIPSGEAPEHIRQAWIGVVIPVPPRLTERRNFLGFGVLSGPKSRLGAVLFLLLGRARLHLLRNAVAHKSDSAKSKFEASIQAIPLLPQEKTPIGFLRSKPHGVSGLTQYQIAVLDLEAIAQKLCM